jgi:tRNA 2-selenouridine synthase
VEGESRRIGRMTLPGNLYDVMRESAKVWCQATVETRVARLTEEYGRPEYRDGMADALGRIRKKLGGDRYEEIAGYLARWELGPFMEGLVRHYYDKLYYKTREWVEDATISLEDYAEGQREIERFIGSRSW